MAKSFQITRLYTDPKTLHSHFDTFQEYLEQETVIGFLGEKHSSSMVQFRMTDGEYDLGLHHAPREQYIIMLQGKVDITTSLGETRRFSSDDLDSMVLLVQDTFGKGHLSKAVDGKPRFSAFIGINDGLKI